MPRIPRIKFPKRHPAPSETASSTPSSENISSFFSNLGKVAAAQTPSPQQSSVHANYRFKSDVPAPPSHTAAGGKASELPKRTPLSEAEIEAIMLGGCF